MHKHGSEYYPDVLSRLNYHTIHRVALWTRLQKKIVSECALAGIKSKVLHGPITDCAFSKKPIFTNGTVPPGSVRRHNMHAQSVFPELHFYILINFFITYCF